MAEIAKLFKMWEAVIDDRTTLVCLHAAGQVRPLDEPFETLTGDYMTPPAHKNCRACVVPYVPGMVAPMRAAANAELTSRPTSRVITRGPRKGQKVNERRIGPPYRNERRTLHPTAKPGIFTEVPLPPPAPVVAVPVPAPVPVVVVERVVAEDPVLGVGALARIRHFIAERRATRTGRVLAAAGRLFRALRRRAG